MTVKDITGNIYADRVVLAQAESRRWNKNKVTYWHVKCLICGHETKVQASSLKNGAKCFVCSRKKGRKKITEYPEEQILTWDLLRNQIEEKNINPRTIRISFPNLQEQKLIFYPTSIELDESEITFIVPVSLLNQTDHENH